MVNDVDAGGGDGLEVWQGEEDVEECGHEKVHGMVSGCGEVG